MANMKTVQRPHRETRVKFQTKSKTISVKAKEKVFSLRKGKVKTSPPKAKIKVEIPTPPKRRPVEIPQDKSKKVKIQKGVSKTKTTALSDQVVPNIATNGSSKKIPEVKNTKKITENGTSIKNGKKNSSKVKRKIGKKLNVNGLMGTPTSPKKVTPEDKIRKRSTEDSLPLAITSLSLHLKEKAALKPRHHKCETCGKAFLGKNDLKKHTLIHSGLRPFVCTHCSKEFRQAGNLKNHISSYHSNVIENPAIFMCAHCNKTFLIKERLRLHMRTHTGLKPYVCDYCSMRFARMGQLRQHERTHTGERNFVCMHCQATFTCGAKLRLHIKGHFDIRDYTCYLCGKRFIRADAIKKHLACFHNGEKPFTCPVCQKSLKGHLQEHMRTHQSEKPHGCAECGTCFAQRSQLTVHQRKHSGERPYRCRVCWKAFAHSTALTLHTRHHTGEKPFKCRICEVSFAQLPHMKKHMQFVHGDSRAYSHPPCGTFFNTKSELDRHLLECSLVEAGPKLSMEEKLSEQIAEAYRPVEPPMALTKMRLLLAVLLKKISSTKRLQKLGFNKRLIDDVLIDSLESAGHVPCKEDSLSIAEKLKLNVQIFLEWTVPPHFMEKFKTERKSTEELLEELTS